MIDFGQDEEVEAGSPKWMATFADLMSLLMCFFVLLLSFSEMDVQKYKQIAGSMKNAFGVQNKINVKDIPKGTSIIAQEFSPGKPTPTDVETINQVTTEITKQSLSVGNPDASDIDPSDLDKEQTEQLLEKKYEELIAQTQEDADKLKELLDKEIREGKIDIESKGRTITIRIRETGSFPSGSATLNPDFVPVMGKLRDSLADIQGRIAVEGHTDNIPIKSLRFKSNWGLSSSRALSVTHELLEDDELDSSRFMVIGHADTKPFKANDNPKNRAQNRRVEIIIRQGLEDAKEQGIEDLKDSSAELNGFDLKVEQQTEEGEG